MRASLHAVPKILRGQLLCTGTGEAAPRVSLPAVKRPEASVIESVAVLPLDSLSYHHLPSSLGGVSKVSDMG